MSCIPMVERRELEQAETGCTTCACCPHCHIRVCKCQCCTKCPTCRARVCVCGGAFTRIGRIDLRARFGMYQVDDSGHMPCRYGVIYALGHGRLSVYIGDHYRVAGALSRIPGVVNCKKYTVPDDSGECEKTYQFHLAQFDAVAKVVKPRRRRTRRLTPGQKAALVARTAHARFKKGRSASDQVSEPPSN
jgi:hypothetical protein